MPTRLSVLPGHFTMCRLPPDAPTPTSEPGAALWSVTRTADELSVLVASEAAPDHPEGRREGPFRAIRVQGTLDFDLVGVLAGLTRVLAQARISVLAISTFDTDYLLVRQDDLIGAVATLEVAGFAVDTHLAREK